jgi:hypothetical protein
LRPTVADDPPCPLGTGDISAPRRQGRPVRWAGFAHVCQSDRLMPRRSTVIGSWSLAGCCRPMQRAAGIWGSTAPERLRDQDAAREGCVTDRDSSGSTGRPASSGGPAPDRCPAVTWASRAEPGRPSHAGRTRQPSAARSCSVGRHRRAVRASVMSIGAVARRELFASLTDGARK